MQARLNGRAPAVAVLLAVPTVLAFFSGGYFSTPREWAGLVAWVFAATGIALFARVIPRNPGAIAAIAGLFLLTGWTLLSIAWAPIAGDAYHAGQIAALYAGTLIAATTLLAGARAQRAVVPALAGGSLVVIGYGLSERLLPGPLHFARSVTALGRLEQPLTYWNAMGELAAIGLVLCTALAGDPSRDRRLRTAAVAAAVPLGMGLYISFSRGALFAFAAGLVALLVVAPRKEQWRAASVIVIAGAIASAAAAPMHGVTSLSGSTATREAQGAVMLAALAAISAGAAYVHHRLRHAQTGQVRLPRHAPLIATAIICAGLALAIAVGSKETSKVPLSGGATRLATLQSNRYEYWRVALKAFAHEPVHGVGAGGWAVWWLRYRKFREGATDAHSLPLQTLAELGLVGAALLVTLIIGVGLAAREAHGRDPAAAAGPLAACVAWLAHAPLDWDWQMPAVTLVVVVLAGWLLAATSR